MHLFRKTFQVKPNMIGFLYRNNLFEKKLPAGLYKINDWNDTIELFCLPETKKLITVTNQEVLSKDNIAFRFSFNYLYRIVDGEKFLSNFTLDKDVFSIQMEAERMISNIIQQFIRNVISGMDSEVLNEKRSEMTDFITEEMVTQVSGFGIEIEQVVLRDLTFPKSIQDLFAKNLEAKIRAKAELENARTTVATARTLKNASESMKENDNIRFIQWLETITKIAEKGKHTFVIGDPDKKI